MKVLWIGSIEDKKRWMGVDRRAEKHPLSQSSESSEEQEKQQLQDDLNICVSTQRAQQIKSAQRARCLSGVF